MLIHGNPNGVPLARVDEIGRVVFLLAPIATPFCTTMIDAEEMVRATYRAAVQAQTEAYCKPPTWGERGRLYRGARDAVKFRLGVRLHGVA